VSPFPALDPEPPPRPLWRAALVPGAVVAAVVVVAVVVVSVLRAPSSTGQSRQPGWSTHLAGEIVGWDMAAHTVLAMSPNGHPSARGVLFTGITTAPLASPSGQALLIGPGQLVTLAGPAATAPYHPGSFHTDDNYGASPVADHDRALVVGGLSVGSHPQTPTVITLANGRRAELPGAPTDEVVGDPVANGAWVTVSPDRPGSFAGPDQEDTGVQHRTPGRAPVSLVPVARMSTEVGFGKNSGSGFGLHLTPYPAPAGPLVAVDALEIGAPAPAPEVMVVFNHAGRVEGKLITVGLEQVVWSRSGQQLLALRAPGTLSLWRGGSAAVRNYRLPTSPGGWADCVFAPSEKYALCAGLNGSQRVTKWALVRLADGAVATESTRNVPVDWLS
jgi:hypothetical protein